MFCLKKCLFESTTNQECSFPSVLVRNMCGEKEIKQILFSYLFIYLFPVRFIQILFNSVNCNALLMKPNSWYPLLPMHVTQSHDYMKKNFLPSSSVMSSEFHTMSCASLHLFILRLLILLFSF